MDLGCLRDHRCGCTILTQPCRHLSLSAGHSSFSRSELACHASDDSGRRSRYSAVFALADQFAKSVRQSALGLLDPSTGCYRAAAHFPSIRKRIASSCHGRSGNRASGISAVSGDSYCCHRIAIDDADLALSTIFQLADTGVPGHCSGAVHVFNLAMAAGLPGSSNAAFRGHVLDLGCCRIKRIWFDKPISSDGVCGACHRVYDRIDRFLHVSGVSLRALS